MFLCSCINFLCSTSLYKSPWARVFVYRGSRVKKTGQPSKQEVVCFPHDASSSSNRSDQYSPVLVPTDLIHIRVGVSPPPGVVVTVHAIPAQFPLAATYIETLISQRYNFEYRLSDADLEAENQKVMAAESCVSPGTAYDRSSPPYSALDKPRVATSPWRTFDTVVIPPSVLVYITELITGYLTRSDIPAMMKEMVFHLLAQSLRMLHVSEGGFASMLPALSPRLSPSLSHLQAELRKLYEEETKNWPSATTVSGSGIGLGVGEQGRFSTYFHSLMEVSLAVAEVTAPVIPGQTSPSPAATEEKASGSSAALPPAGSTSPMSAGKRKKLKAKRERDRGTMATRRSSSPRRLSASANESDESPRSSSPPPDTGVGASASSSSSSMATASGSAASLTGAKTEGLLWFHRALTMTQILRYVVYKDPIGQGVTVDAVADAAQSLSTPTAHQRLLVICGLPKQADPQTVEKALRKTCNTCGGLFKDEVYLPTERMLVKTPVKKTTPKKAAPHRSISEPYTRGEDTTQRDANAAPSSSQSEDSTDRSRRSVSPKAPIRKQSQQADSQAEEGDSKAWQTRLQGFAVLNLRSKVKVEQARKALGRSQALQESFVFEGQQLAETSDESLTVELVNQSLMIEPAHSKANAALEAYLVQKIVLSRDTYELTDSAMIALTEIFHSCFISEQRLSLIADSTKQESGYICLGKDQILMQTQGNLMFQFFSIVRPAKKSCGEQVSQVLRRYGVPKVMDKDE